MFPGSPKLWPRMYAAHILIFPVLIGLLLSVHLFLVAMKHHTQFRRTRAQSQNAVMGVPTFPGQTPRSLGLMIGTAGILFLLGGLVQINPIWLWGPYHTYSSTNGAQPDWYLGWLIGGLRLVPHWDFVIGDYTLVPNAFWGGAAFPLAVFGFLYFWPWIERKLTGDTAFHNVLQRPRDNPLRTGVGVGMATWVLLVQLAGSADRVYVLFDISYTKQIWVYRVLVFAGPVAAGLVAAWLCRQLQRAERAERDQHAAKAEARLVQIRGRPDSSP
jgi:ubiquinol-cytochrome c reductase cytochrome b subunit